MMLKAMIRRRNLAGVLLLLATVVPANALVQNSPYRPKTGSDGYRDIAIAPARWRIVGTMAFDYAGKSTKIAVYRGALLAKANGFPFLKIVNGKIYAQYRGSVHVSDTADMTMVGLPAADMPAPCEAKGEFVKNCQLVVVEEIIPRYGKALFRSPAQQQDDLEAVRNLPLRK